MRLLLDTHTLVWSVLRPHQLSDAAREAIGDARNEIFISTVNAWEVSIKASLGKLLVPEDVEARILRACKESGFSVLPVELNHAFEVRHLPFIHKDPFDRLLVAQARTERLRLVTIDGWLSRYGVDLLW